MTKTKTKTKPNKLLSFVNEMKTTTKGMTKGRIRTPLYFYVPFLLLWWWWLWDVGVQDKQYLVRRYHIEPLSLPCHPYQRLESPLFSLSLFFCLSLRLWFFYYPRRDHYSSNPLALCVIFCITLSILVPSFLAPTIGWFHPAPYQ